MYVCIQYTEYLEVDGKIFAGRARQAE